LLSLLVIEAAISDKNSAMAAFLWLKISGLPFVA